MEGVGLGASTGGRGARGRGHGAGRLPVAVIPVLSRAELPMVLSRGSVGGRAVGRRAPEPSPTRRRRCASRQGTASGGRRARVPRERGHGRGGAKPGAAPRAPRRRHPESSRDSPSSSEPAVGISGGALPGGAGPCVTQQREGVGRQPSQAAASCSQRLVVPLNVRAGSNDSTVCRKVREPRPVERERLGACRGEGGPAAAGGRRRTRGPQGGRGPSRAP